MQIQFTGNAQVRGRGYRRGDVAELDDATAEAYIRAQQAKPFVAPSPKATAADSDPEGDDSGPAANRGGKNVRKATKPKVEQR